ncbi:hypothetical protein IPN41_03830 [Candidatus Falkowbacteria bacterium]|nr:MAG: hypothetical protein IPN41_03830 [Candidatus Falkowbacteria bacterium]
MDWNSSNFSDYERIVSGPSVSTYTSAQGIGQYTECALEGNAFCVEGLVMKQVKLVFIV